MKQRLAPDRNIAVCRRIITVEDAVGRVAGMVAVASYASITVMTAGSTAWITSSLLPLLFFEIELRIIPRIELGLWSRPLVWCRLSIPLRLRVIIAVVACAMSQGRCIGPMSVGLRACRSLDEIMWTG